jgi:hypothetical protein
MLSAQAAFASLRSIPKTLITLPQPLHPSSTKTNFVKSIAAISACRYNLRPDVPR